MNRTIFPGSNHLFLTGSVLTVFGVIAIATPALAGKAVVWIIGGLLLLAGLLQLYQAWRVDSWRSRVLPLILGILTTACGVGAICQPFLGMAVLATLLALFFVAEGLWKIIASFSFRPASGWVGMLISGMLALILGGLIWAQWPMSGLWAVGILVGVDLLTTGIAMIGLSITLRRLAKSVNVKEVA
jgi:uncharacterized membrane protein HdeD (DUF308 family)